MARRQTRGKCAFCEKDIAKVSAIKHLVTCPAWHEEVDKAEASKRKSETLYNLRVQAEGQAEFWLNLEMRGSAKLKDLDHYLREIWLECCGHLSQFSFGGWGGQEISICRSISEVSEFNDEVTHIYDFGTESVSLIKIVGERQGKPITSHPITLLMRNIPPVYECQECGKPAAWLCMECIYEDEAMGTLCNTHVKKHPHDNYESPIRLVNSPRLGLCGYDGPAKPPY